MVRVKPFKGITYNFEKLAPTKELFAPPYDVISPEYQDTLYERSPYNVVRLILGKTADTDNDSNNRYTRAAEAFDQWLQEGVLLQSDVPKMYFYVQKYKDAKGVDVVRKGFIATCYLEDFESGQILPHEETMGGPKQDRLALMEAVQANLSQIFVVYSDPEKLVDTTLQEASPEKPSVDIVDDDGVQHIFYEVTDEEALSKVTAYMSKQNLLIADGHHRYETALNYRNLRRSQNNGDTSEEKPYNSMMIYFANFDDEGLRVYPTHRALKPGIEYSLVSLLEHLEKYFTIKKVPFENFEECFPAMEKIDPLDVPIGLVSRKNNSILYILLPDKEAVSKELSAMNVGPDLAMFDATILHRLILEKIMGLDTIELKKQSNIEFVRDEQALSDKFNKDEASLVFLLSPPEVDVVKKICLSGSRMPQKSTYFYPKVLSGLVLNSLK